jgi:hypothetical protein
MYDQMHERSEPTQVTAANIDNMRKIVIACLASALLASALHAEEQKAGGALTSGFIGGAAAGAGKKPNTYPGDKTKSANRNSDQVRSLLVKPTAKAKPKAPGSRQQQDRQ